MCSLECRFLLNVLLPQKATYYDGRYTGEERWPHQKNRSSNADIMRTYSQYKKMLFDGEYYHKKLLDGDAEQ